MSSIEKIQGEDNSYEYTLLVIKMDIFFSPQFHGIFLAVGDI